MRRLILSMILLVAFSTAQVEWSGYFESEGDYIRLPSENLYFGYNKLRLDFDMNPVEQVHIAGDMVYRFYNGKTSINFMDFLDQSLRPYIPATDETGGLILDSLGNPVMVPLNDFAYTFPDTVFMDNIFLELRTHFADFTLGLQQISPGVGYAWNPTDIFNIKDLLDPTYEQTGVRALRMEIPYKRWIFTGILQPQKDWLNTTQYYQLKGGLSRWDASLVYAKLPYRETGLLQSTSWIRDLYGFNLEGELFGVGLHAEAAANRLNYRNGNIKKEYLVGGDYTTESSLYLLMEYYHNDFGANPDETDFDDYLTYFMGERKSINRDYLFMTSLYPVTDLLTGGFLLISNLGDNSFAFNPQLIYSLYDNVELNLLVSLFYGDKRDEFGYQEYGARLRLRAYF